MTREEKINTLKAIIQECEDYQWQRKETLFEIIKELEKEPKKGHWLDTGWISECSCCHERSYPFDDTGYGSIYNHFCPNCGADMREDLTR